MGKETPILKIGMENVNLERGIANEFNVLKNQINDFNLGQLSDMPIEKKRKLLDLLQKVNSTIKEARKPL